jgi:hypothetical protein
LLVQGFLNRGNFQYYALYPPTFLEEYTQWWSDRSSGGMLCPEFTCLLLRVYSCSIQNTTPELRHSLEFELAESIDSLSKRYFQAAQDLNKAFPPGYGGIKNVQQLFLAVNWLKTEAQIVESWHMLGTAVHAAQEIGKCDKRRA